MTPLVLATTNKGKLVELRALLAGLPFDLKDLSAFPPAPSVEEDGDTFAANALLKARALAEHTGCWALADDSGLVVDALGGAPGIRSARYAGVGASDADNRDKLRAALRGMPMARRSARFVAEVVVVDGAGEIVAASRGECEGHVLDEERGEGGFGYDRLFQPLGHDRTLAQMEPEEKDALSHRGEAIRRLAAALARPNSQG